MIRNNSLPRVCRKTVFHFGRGQQWETGGGSVKEDEEMKRLPETEHFLPVSNEADEETALKSGSLRQNKLTFEG